MRGGRDCHELVVVVPVLRRAHRVAPLLESLEAATPEPHRVVFVATATDRPMVDEVLRVASETSAVLSLEILAPARVGDYARKINYVAATSSEPFLFLAADDLHFHPGWYPAARALMGGGIGVVGTQDLAPTDRARSGQHATHFLVAREYVARGTIDEPGKLLHEGYPHEYVDDEFVQTAKKREAWAFAAASVVEHLHPSWGKAPRDPLYDAQRQRMNAGRAVLIRRRKLWT